MSTLHLHIEGLSDVSMVEHLEKSLEAVPGVNSVAVDIAAQEACIEHDSADTGLLVAAAAGEGFRVSRM